MKKFCKGIFICSLPVLMFSCESVKNSAHNSSVENRKQDTEEFRSLIIYYTSETTKNDLISKAKKYGVDVFYSYENINAIAVRVPDHMSILKAEKFFSGIKGVAQVVKDSHSQLNTTY